MLKKEIGDNAGMIWHLLEKHGSMCIREIGEKTYSKEVLIALSLGWLARENKILFTQKQGDYYIELNQSSPEIYY